MKKGTPSAAAITIFLIALNTISVKRFVDKFNENAFQKESTEFSLESVKRDSINTAVDLDFNKRLAVWENQALSTQETKAALALAERKVRVAQLDTNKTAKGMRIANAQAEIESVKLKAFTSYEKKDKRPQKKEVFYTEPLVNPDRGSSGWVWFLSAIIGLLLAGVEYAVIQKSVTGLPFMIIGIIYGSVLLYVHQAAMVFYFELPATVGIGFSLLLTISAFLNYVQIAEQKLGGGVRFLSESMKGFWKKLDDAQKLESEKREKFRQQALWDVDSEVEKRVKAYRADKDCEFAEYMASLEVQKGIAINKIIREGFLKDADNMEKAVDEFFAMEKRFDRFGNEFKPDIRKAFTQRLITMKNAMVELPDRIAEKPHTNGKAIHPQPAPVLGRPEPPRLTFDLDREPSIIMPPREDVEQAAVEDYGVKNPLAGNDDESEIDNGESDVNFNNFIELPKAEKKIVTDADILADARARKLGGEKMTVSKIENTYDISHRQAYKIFQILGK